MSFYMIISLAPLVHYFEPQFWANTKSWWVLVLWIMVIVWEWAMVAAVHFSDTRCLALALTLGLTFGDLGLTYVKTAIISFKFGTINILGLFGVLIGLLWLLFRMITLCCDPKQENPIEDSKEQLSMDELALYSQEEKPKKKSSENTSLKPKANNPLYASNQTVDLSRFADTAPKKHRDPDSNRGRSLDPVENSEDKKSKKKFGNPFSKSKP